MYVCKATCKTTLYIHVGKQDMNIEETKQLFESQYKKNHYQYSKNSSPRKL